jgi:hypothetical protein
MRGLDFILKILGFIRRLRGLDLILRSPRKRASRRMKPPNWKIASAAAGIRLRYATWQQWQPWLDYFPLSPFFTGRGSG